MSRIAINDLKTINSSLDYSKNSLQTLDEKQIGSILGGCTITPDVVSCTKEELELLNSVLDKLNKKK
ncbi:MAG: hypothetical protein AB4063_00515 [Crocosphaera sp.]